MTSLLHLIETEEIQTQIQGVLERHNLQQYSALVDNILEQVFEGTLYYEDFNQALENEVDEVTDDVLSAESEIYLICVEPHEEELEKLFSENKKNFNEVLTEVQARFHIETEGDRYKDRLARFLKSFFEGEYDSERTIRSLSKGFKPGGLEMKEEDARVLVESVEAYVGRISYDAVSSSSDSSSLGLVSHEVTSPEVATALAPVATILVDTPQELTKQAQTAESHEIVPVSLVDTVSELQPQKAEVVLPKLPQEKAREEALYQAKTAILQKNTFAESTPVVKTVPIEVTKKDEVVSTNNSVVCDVLEDAEVTELMKAKDGIDETIAGESRIHEELQKVFQKIVDTYASFLTSSELCDRFYRLVIARLKGLKDQYATRDVVLSPVENGGLGFSPSQADDFLTFLETEKNILQETWDQEIKIKKEEFLSQRREQLFSKNSVTPLKTVPTNQMTGDIIGVVPTPPKPATPVAPHLQTSKPIMHDVHDTAPMLDGVMELQSYSLEDFHRLSKDPVQAAHKIEQKIDILGQWMYVKRAQGIDAWKDSALMRLYREHLQQSLLADMPITEVIQRRTEAGQPTLTLAEIEALTDLSSRLRK